MKTRKWRLEDGRWNARSILECGSHPPLFLPQYASHGRQSARGLAHSKTWRLWLICFCFLLSGFYFWAWGQYSIDWSKIAGGGGTSTGGVYSVAGTIGQPDAGAAMSGGDYSLTGGFWSLVAAVPTPGAPWLTITLNPQLSTITVSWAVSDTSWQLQATTSLVSTGSTWTPCAYTTNGANCVYIESPPIGNRFYRLHKP